MLVKFKYPEGEITIQITQQQTAEQACYSFANKAGINADDYYFKYVEKMLKPEEPLIAQLELTEENQDEIVITAIKKDREKDQIVNIDIEGVKEKVVVKEGGILEDAIGKLFKYLKKPLPKFKFLYNGRIVDENDRRKTFRQVANRFDKQKKEMNVLAMGDGIDEQLNDNEIHQSEDDANKMKENEENSNNQDEVTDLLLMNSFKFFIKLYTFLLVQFILIGVLTFLGFKYEIDDYFSNSSKAFNWTISVITIFALISSLIPFCLSEKPKTGFCAFFLWFVYIPIITIYCFLLKRHEGTDIMEGFYIIYQLIIFALDCLFMIIANAIFKRYRGLINLLILCGINAIAIYVMAGPLSNNYDNLEMSHSGFVNISIISSVMIALIIMFNIPIVALNKEEDETANALVGALAFNSVPFVIAFAFGIIALLIGIVLAVFAIVLALFVVVLLLGGLFS